MDNSFNEDSTGYLDEEGFHLFSEDDSEEVQCPRCHGMGFLLVDNEEVDCMECLGMGSFLIS